VYYSFYAGSVEEEEAVGHLINHEGLAEIDAIKNGRILPIKLGEVYCSGVRTMNGVQTMLEGLYPDDYQK